MTNRNVWFVGGLERALRELSRKTGVSFNKLVNEAVAGFLGCCDDEGLRLFAEKVALKREERELKDDWRVIARSGSYLPRYVDRVVRPKDSLFRRGQVPLRALSVDEEDVFLRIARRREEIARRLVEIDKVLLPKKRFKLKPSPSRKALHDKKPRRR